LGAEGQALGQQGWGWEAMTLGAATLLLGGFDFGAATLLLHG